MAPYGIGLRLGRPSASVSTVQPVTGPVGPPLGGIVLPTGSAASCASTCHHVNVSPHHGPSMIVTVRALSAVPCI